MSASLGPEMKFFRWILSHLTLIIIVSLMIYFYWNRNEMWPDDTVKILSADSKTHESKAFESKTLESKGSIYNIESGSQSSSGFSERMSQYKQTLQVDEQKVMIEAEDLTQEVQGVQEVSDEAIKYPTESIIRDTPEYIEPNTEIENNVSNTHASRVKVKNKDLQQQIRNRQKQLQNQMIMLVPINSEMNSDKKNN